MNCVGKGNNCVQEAGLRHCELSESSRPCHGKCRLENCWIPEMDSCVYNWSCDRKMGSFTTTDEAESVTDHEVINTITILGAEAGIKYQDTCIGEIIVY